MTAKLTAGYHFLIMTRLQPPVPRSVRSLSQARLRELGTSGGPEVVQVMFADSGDVDLSTRSGFDQILVDIHLNRSAPVVLEVRPAPQDPESFTLQPSPALPTQPPTDITTALESSLGTRM